MTDLPRGATAHGFVTYLLTSLLSAFLVLLI